jgi:hypothetical protein
MQQNGLTSILMLDATKQCPNVLDPFPHWSPCDFLQQRRFRKQHGFALKAAEKDHINVKRAKMLCPCSMKVGSTKLKHTC